MNISAARVLVDLRVWVAGLCLFAAAALPPVSADEGDWVLTFAEPKNEDESRMRSLLQGENALPDMIELLESLFSMKETINLKVGTEDGPYYEAGAEIITIPYHFALEIEQRFLTHGDPERVDLEQLDDIVLDVIMHTLFHELGHALMAQYELPLFFEEEDVVDSLANILLIEHTEYGPLVATSAAEMYRLEHEGMDEFQASDFWDEHSLDLQRHYDVYCSIYGANPDANENIITDVFDGDQNQANVCIDTYERVRESWDPLLEPIILQ